MKSQFFASVCLSACAIGLALPATASAQETVAGGPQEDNQEAGEDRVIVVTGTLIRGTPEDSALPVDVFSNEELTAEGQTSPLDFIKDIPAVGGVVGDSNQFQVQGLGAVGTINLRGLGPQRTLVLLNGRRTIVSPGDGLVDTNLLPLFAVGRVELLKDGAAVTYGSDAVAGVANFITRTDFEGLEVQGDYRFIDDSDGDWTASILGGINVGDANFLAGFGYRHRSPLAAFNRDFSNQPPDINPSPYSGVVNPAQYFPVLRTTGPIRDNDPDNIRVAPFGTPGATTFILGGGIQDVGCTDIGGFIQPANGRCFYQYTDYNNLVEESNFYQGYVAMNVDLDERTRFTADVLYAYSEAFTKLSPSYPATQSPKGPGLTFPFFVPRSNPGFDTFLAQTGATINPAANGVQAVLYRPFALGGFPLSDKFPYGNDSFSENESYRVSVGFERDLSDSFTASLYGTYIDGNSRAAVQDTLGVRFQNALDGLGGPDCDVATGTPGQGNCYYFNPFSNAIGGNPVTGQTNPNYVGPDAGDPRANNNRADVIDFFTEPAASSNQTERQYVVDFLLSGTLDGLDLGSGPVGLGIGAQYRKSDYELTPTNFSSSVDNPCQQIGDQQCPFPLGPFIFQGPLNPANTQQDVYAIFGEVQVPILDRLEVNLALRFEDYGDPIGSTLDPKASFRFEALDWLVLRGSVGTTFRAPLAGQVAPGIQFTNLTGINAAGGFFFPVDRIGNPDLGPESAFTYNLGFVVDTGPFNLQVDYFSYDFDGPLISQPENPIASAVFNGPGNTTDCTSPVASLIVFNAGTCVPGTTASAGLARVLTQFVNGPSIKTDGFDVEADYTLDAGDLTLTFGTAFTYILNYDVDDFVINGVTVVDAYDAVGFLNADRAQASLPEFKSNSFVNLNVGGLNARYVFRFSTGLTDERYENPGFAATPFGESFYGRDIDEFTQHDFTLLYDLPFEFADIQLQGSVENIFDEDPPVTRQVLGYDPFVGNPLGRVFRLGIKAGF